MPTIEFRQDTVRTLPYVGRGGKHQCVYWATSLESFGVRVYPSGRRTYVCSYRISRRKRLAKLGRADVMPLDQARKKAMAYLGQAANTADPATIIGRPEDFAHRRRALYRLHRGTCEAQEIELAR